MHTQLLIMMRLIICHDEFNTTTSCKSLFYENSIFDLITHESHNVCFKSSKQWVLCIQYYYPMFHDDFKISYAKVFYTIKF